MDWLEPIMLLALGGLVTLFSQRYIEDLKSQRALVAAEKHRTHEAEMRLRDERRKTYLRVLDPYIEVLSEMGRGGDYQAANARLLSVEHRKAAFELKLVATDEVVEAFNAFARYIIDVRSGSDQDVPGELLRRWAHLLLSIRKSVGDPETGVTPKAMLVDWVTDIDLVFPNQNGPDGRTADRDSAR